MIVRFADSERTCKKVKRHCTARGSWIGMVDKDSLGAGRQKTTGNYGGFRQVVCHSGLWKKGREVWPFGMNDFRTAYILEIEIFLERSSLPHAEKLSAGG